MVGLTSSALATRRIDFGIGHYDSVATLTINRKKFNLEME